MNLLCPPETPDTAVPDKKIEAEKSVARLSFCLYISVFRGGTGTENFDAVSSSACVYAGYKQRETSNPGLSEVDAYPADPEDGYGWEKLFSERMCRHFQEDYGVTTKVARFHNVYGPDGTFDGGRFAHIATLGSGQN